MSFYLRLASKGLIINHNFRVLFMTALPFGEGAGRYLEALQPQTQSFLFITILFAAKLYVLKPLNVRVFLCPLSISGFCDFRISGYGGCFLFYTFSLP